MFWDNKTVDIKRIVDWEFVDINTIRCRYEPKKFTSLREQETKQNHITFRLFCDSKEIRVTDKVVHWNRSFIVSWISDYDDQNWSHLELLMLEENSWVHENVTINSLNTTQDNYDELTWEWKWTKDYTTRTLSVIMDIAKLMKNKFTDMTEWWQIVMPEYAMTVFYPETIANEDKIVYNGNTYEVKFILDFPHQKIVWLDKYIKDYEQ